MKRYEITHEDVLMFSTLLGTTQGLIEVLESVGHRTITDAARAVMDDAEKHLRAATPVISDESELVAAARKFVPTHTSVTNLNIRDRHLVPVDVTMGDLRALVSAIDRAANAPT